MRIREFDIPPRLIEDLELGGRKLSADEFRSFVSLLKNIDNPCPKLYGLEQIVEQDRFWSSSAACDYIGRICDGITPGSVDPKKTLIIGEAEPDSPIALDYRTLFPTVVYLGDVDYESSWIEVAANYSELIDKLT